MSSLVWTVLAVLLVVWLVGLVLRWGALVNLLLVAAAVLLVVQLLNERRT